MTHNSNTNNNNHNHNWEPDTCRSYEELQQELLPLNEEERTEVLQMKLDNIAERILEHFFEDPIVSAYTTYVARRNLEPADASYAPFYRDEVEEHPAFWEMRTGVNYEILTTVMSKLRTKL